MCKVKAEEHVSLYNMNSRLTLTSLESRLRKNRLRWYEHVGRGKKWMNHCTQVEVVLCRGRGRPRKTLKESVKVDLCLWNIHQNMVHDRTKWKNATNQEIANAGNRGKLAHNGYVNK